MATQVDLSIRQGIALRGSVVYCNPLPGMPDTPDESNPIDLTGYTARLRVRMKGGGGLLELTTAPSGGLTIIGASGIINILITDVQTAALRSSSGRWDLVVVNPTDGLHDLIGEGDVKLKDIVS